MNARVKDLFDEARKLSFEERAELLDLLLLAAHGDPDPEAERAWNDETRRRIEKYDQGETKAVKWDDVRDEMLSKWKSK